jgi:hypothetical protein
LRTPLLALSGLQARRRFAAFLAEGAGLTEDNELYVSRRDYQARKWEAFTLDRVRRSWTPVQVPSGSGQGRRVLGFDGEDLLTCIDYDVISYYKPCKEKGTER